MARWMNVHETSCYRTRDAEFNDWYDRVHLPDVLETPGYRAATRYRAKEFRKGRGAYLTLYAIESDDIAATMRTRAEKLEREVDAGRGSDLWVPVWPFVLYRELSHRESTVNPHDPARRRWVSLVETHALPGREREFNAWYDEQHLDEVLATPGYVAATRYEIGEPLDGRGRYLTIYYLESDDVDETLRVRRATKAREVAEGRDPGLWIGVWVGVVFEELVRMEAKRA